MNHIQLFISAVTNEFGSYRQALRRDLDRYNVSVKTQADFIQFGAEMLDKLDTYIMHCEAVIHIAGDMTGSMAAAPSVAFIQNKYPHMVEKMPLLKDALEGKETFSYTQWEAYLAIFHGKALYISVPEPGAPRDEKFGHDETERAHQQAHLRRLRDMHKHPAPPFANADRLAVQILRSDLHELLMRAGRKPVNLPYHSLGSLFKGRETFMERLRESLLRPAARPQASAITGRALYGLGGIGKTRLAVEYGWQHIGEYTALLCIFAGSPEALHANMAALCGPLVLNLPEQQVPEEEVRLGAALRWLEDHPGWLLIIDNVDTPEAALEVEGLLPYLHGGHVLVTSRISQWSTQVQRLELDVLAVEDAVAFLLERTKDSRLKEPGEEIVANRLAHDLGRLALALEQAGAYISEQQLTLAEYETAWKENHDALMDAHFDQMLYPKSVAATWQTSFRQLGAAAQRLMNRLAWLSPEPIPRSLVKEPVPGVEEQDDGMAALAELARYSLVTRAHDAPFFTVHKLVQDVACSMMDEATSAKTLEEALMWVDTAFKGDAQDVRSWPVLDPLLPHALKAAQAADAHKLSAKASRLLSQLGLLLMMKAQHAEAEPLMRRALDIDEQNYGVDHPDVAISLNNLAQLLQATNRLTEAEPLMRRALNIDERSYGVDHPDVAIRLNNLAGLLRETNRLVEAEPLMRQALDIDEQGYGKGHPNVAIRLNNLAQLLKATNRLTEAEPMMRRALDIDKQSYGVSHPNVAIRLNNLVGLLMVTDRLVEAEPLMRRALDIDEQNYGADHPNVATRLNNLAQLLKATNRLAEAELLMRRGLSIFISFGTNTGHQHPHLSTATNNYVVLLKQMGMDEEGIQAAIDSLVHEQ